MAENYFGITDTGKLRDNNEDSFIAETVLNGQLIAACVIDGVGGYSGGEVAARLVHDAILNHLNIPSGDIMNMMKEAFAAANEMIYSERLLNKEIEQMACVLTLALADIPNNKFYYAHVGDTRLYLFRDNTLVKVTHDHSFVGFLEDSGRLTKEAAMNHPKRNEVNKALGFNTQISIQDYIETGDSPFLPGDIILLCSDGLSDMIDNSTITSILNTNKTLSEKAKALIGAANDAGGKDNITAVLVYNNKSPLKHTAMKPVVSIKKNDEVLKEEVVESDNEQPGKVLIKDKKRSGRTVSVLSILCFVLLAAFLWQLYQNYRIKETPEEFRNVPIKKKRNEPEQKLADSINAASNNKIFVAVEEGGRSILITDSLFIQNDSLHIMGNGVTLLRDTSYTGPALILSASCKYILLDSMTIENFDVGILMQNRALHLKNVQFKNCLTSIQYQFLFPNDTVVTGRFADTLFYNSNSLLK